MDHKEYKLSMKAYRTMRSHYARLWRESRQLSSASKKKTCFLKVLQEKEAQKKFKDYYKLQNICPESEWDHFMDVLKSGLPASFRIIANKEAGTLLKLIEGPFFTNLLKEELSDRENNSKLFCLPWYPQRLGWQLKISKDILDSKAYIGLHKFLCSGKINGSISTQDTVTMIPPLFLDIKPSDKVLDMCAAPGFQTAQLIEDLYSRSTSSVPDGLIMANDIHINRCFSLVQQANRLKSANVVITNHDATVLPTIYLDEEGDSVLKFDKILCDVSCSRDGARYDKFILSKWTPARANNIHKYQVPILKRGVELLNIGGRLVYTNCSFNPIENEAVVQHILSEAKDSVVLINAHDKLAGLKTVKGLSQWIVASKHLDVYSTFDEVPEKWATDIIPQMFPPEEDLYNLNKCVRILPHHQDTGGLFMAVMEKIKPLPWEINANKPKVETVKSVNDAQNKKTPYVFLTIEDPIWPEIRDFYEFNDFPTHCLLFKSSKGKKSTIYFTSSSIRDIVKNNQEQINIINMGVKTFVRCNNKTIKCNFRLSQEGLASISSYIGQKRRLQLTCKEIIIVLKNQTIPITDLEQATRDKLGKFGIGSCVLNMVDELLSLELVGWKGTACLTAHITFECRLHYLRLLGVDVSQMEEFESDEDEIEDL